MIEAEQTPKRRGRPPGSTNRKVSRIEIIHNGTLWLFPEGTRIRRVMLDRKAWLIVAPALERPFLVDDMNRKRHVTDDDQEMLLRLVSADPGSVVDHSS